MVSMVNVEMQELLKTWTSAGYYGKCFNVRIAENLELYWLPW